MEPEPIRIIQISDTHVLADEGSLLGVNTTQSFRAVLDLIQSQPEQPDLFLLTGDLSQDDSEASYIEIANLLKPLNIPTYFVPGNHDDEQMLSRVYPRDTIYADKQILLPQWQLVLLNSKKDQAVEGYLAPGELAYLQACLEAHPERYTVVAFHHHPVAIASRWADTMGLLNADKLWSILAEHSQVKAVLFGHIHQQQEGEINGVRYLSVPSTCFQFKPQSDTFGLENIPQGYRWLNLHADGRIETGVIRLPRYVGTFVEKVEAY